MDQQGTDERGRYAAVLAATRVFAIVILAPSVAFTFNYGIILNTVMLSAVWMAAIFADGIRRIPLMPALVVEASMVTFLAALSLTESSVLLPALVVPLFIGGLVRGIPGAFQVLGAEIAVLAATILPSSEILLDENLGLVLFTWLMLGLGFGLIAATVHRMKLEDEGTTSYRDARELITQLLELSDSLVEGLDPVSIGQHVVDLAREEIPLSGVLVHVRTPDGQIAVLEGEAAPAPAPDRDALVLEAFEKGEALHRVDAVAIPVRTEASVVAVLSAGLAPGFDLDEVSLRSALAAVVKSVRPEALKLDTAILFSAVRESATTEERQRLAREMHDGVAQDLASFGYLIDDVAATADTPEQAARVAALRSELSNVVAELRRSVFSLRNEAMDKRPLGESIQALAQHIQDRSGIVVDVTVEDGPARLLPAVETELLRIVQEGMNNAVKHSAASRITVTSKVVAPYAAVTVRDDGVGLKPGRDDSHGIRIMRERARRIGGTIELTDTGNGALLRVYIAPAGNGRNSETLLEGSMQS